jgi:hypothetical protein
MKTVCGALHLRTVADAYQQYCSNDSFRSRRRLRAINGQSPAKLSNHADGSSLFLDTFFGRTQLRGRGWKLHLTNHGIVAGIETALRAHARLHIGLYERDCVLETDNLLSANYLPAWMRLPFGCFS